MSDATKDYMFYIIGLLALIIPLLREVFKNYTFFKHKKFVVIYILFLSGAFILLLWLGIDKINRDNVYRNNSDTSIKKLSLKIDSIKIDKSADSTKYIDLKDFIYKRFPVKDSSGFPVYKKEYKNYVNKPEKVYFDQR